MGGYERPRVMEQRVIWRRWVVGEEVGSVAGQRAVVQAFQHAVFVYETASCCIDEESAGLHRLQPIAIDEAGGVGCQRDMEAHNIGGSH